MATPVGFTALTATRIQDATGTLIASGSLNILPTDANDQPIGTTAGGVGGPMASTFAALIPITNGGLVTNALVADTAMTLNQHISYRFVFKDATGATFLTWRGVQPTGASFDLDTYTPNNTPQAVIQPGPQGPPGLNGTVTGAQASSLLGATIRPGQNVLNPNGWVPGLLNLNTGVFDNTGVNGSSFITSPLLAANSGGQMVANPTVPGIAGVAGITFHDITGAFLPGQSLYGAAANTPFAVPATAVFFRISTYAATQTATFYVGYGTSVPTPQPSFAAYSAAEVDAKLGTLNTSLTASIGALTQSAVTIPALSLARNAERSTTRNLLNPAGWSSGYVNYYDGSIHASTSYVYSPLVPANTGGQMVSNVTINNIAGGTGIAFYAADGLTFVAGLPSANANAPFNVPATAAFLRFTDYTGNPNASYWLGDGTAVPSPTPTFATYSAGEIDTKLGAITGASVPFQGKHMLVFGDSYSDLNQYGYGRWQIKVAADLGMSLTTYALSSRTYSAAALPTNYIFTDFMTGPSGAFNPAAFATALAGVDVVVIALGTNDIKLVAAGSETLGSPTDASTAATACGAIRYALEQIFIANPRLKVFGVGVLHIQPLSGAPNAGGYSGFFTDAQADSFNAAAQAIYQSMGCPFFNPAFEAGFNNRNYHTPAGDPLTLSADGLHPSNEGFDDLYAPFVEGKLLGYRPY